MNEKTKIAVIIPAFNEEEAIGPLLQELKKELPEVDIVVINDGSSDGTEQIARNEDVNLLNLPCNLGVGSAIQAGYKLTFEKGYDIVVRIDGDGQHPPEEISKLIAAITAEDVDLIIGSRYIEKSSFGNTTLRSFGIKLLALFLSIICRAKITDPTSGFWVIKRNLLYYFCNDYPYEYPEPEAIALMRRHGYSYKEIPVRFRARIAGKSTIRGWGSVYYMIKVGLALIVDRIRPINPRFEKSKLRSFNGSA